MDLVRSKALGTQFSCLSKAHVQCKQEQQELPVFYYFCYSSAWGLKSEIRIFKLLGAMQTHNTSNSYVVGTNSKWVQNTKPTRMAATCT